MPEVKWVYERTTRSLRIFQRARELSVKLWHVTHCQPRECICNMACVGDFQEMEAATIPALTQAHAAGRRAGLEEAAQDGEQE